MKTNRKTDMTAKKNENLGRILRKGISMALIMAATMLLLMGCSGTKLSGDFDEEKVKAAAHEAIDHLAARTSADRAACISSPMSATHSSYSPAVSWSMAS